MEKMKRKRFSLKRGLQTQTQTEARSEIHMHACPASEAENRVRTPIKPRHIEKVTDQVK